MRGLPWFLGGVLCTAAVAVGALTLTHRVRTGQWAPPTPYDLQWVERQVRAAGDPPRTVYLHRGALTLRPGLDDAHDDRSSMVDEPVTMPGFTGSDRQWRAMMRCVRAQFAPFDVTITDARPRQPGYVMVAVGGKPHALDMDPRLTGLAPTREGGYVPDAVAFVFARSLGNRARAICEVAAHEIAHTYGLDHTTHCADIMSYRQCGNKRFVDRPMRCGERGARPCDDGAKSQNSFRKLLRILGPRRVS